ncbi:unnamed protein product [Prunus brigantina]
MVKKTRGRQKVDMVKMENDSHLQVTFSKRRSGLFKKASELCTLCGAEIAIIVFSPGKKVFCFGHPGIETLLDRFEGTVPRQILNSETQKLIDGYRIAGLCEITDELTRVLEVLEEERKWGDVLTQSMKAKQEGKWWQRPVEEMELDQLEALKASLLELKSKVADEAKLRLSAAESANLAHNPNFCVGSSSSSAAAQNAKPAHNNFFVGSSSSRAVAGPSGLQGLVNPDINNVGFNFNGNDHVMQAPHQPNNVGFNGNPNAMPLSGWNPNLGGGFL